MELANGVPTVAMGSFLLLSARAMAYDATARRRVTLPVEAESRMRMTAWVAFFLVSNVLGVAAFRAAMTLPLDEGLIRAEHAGGEGVGEAPGNGRAERGDSENLGHPEKRNPRRRARA